MDDLIYFVISYALIIIIGWLLINFLSNGFLNIFMKVKASRGSKLLVKVRSKTQHYFVSGVIEGEFLVFHDRESKSMKNKTPKRLVVNVNDFYRAFNLICIDVDEAKGIIIKPDGNEVEGFDPIKWNNILTRALTKPSLDQDELMELQKKLTIVAIILTIVCLAGIGYLVVLNGEVMTAINGITSVTGGNV